MASSSPLCVPSARRLARVESAPAHKKSLPVVELNISFTTQLHPLATQAASRNLNLLLLWAPFLSLEVACQLWQGHALWLALQRCHSSFRLTYDEVHGLAITQPHRQNLDVIVFCTAQTKATKAEAETVTWIVSVTRGISNSVLFSRLKNAHPLLPLDIRFPLGTP